MLYTENTLLWFTILTFINQF